MSNVNIEEREDIIIVHLHGDLITETIKRIEAVWNEQIAKSPEAIAIDFNNLNRIDSMGLSHLLKLSKIAADNNIELIIYDLKESVYNLLERAEIENLFRILSKDEFESIY